LRFRSKIVVTKGFFEPVFEVLADFEAFSDFRGLKVLMRDKQNHENRQNPFLVDENPPKPLKTL
jgi:hypothetical protein